MCSICGIEFHWCQLRELNFHPQSLVGTMFSNFDSAALTTEFFNNIGPIRTLRILYTAALQRLPPPMRYPSSSMTLADTLQCRFARAEDPVSPS